MTGILFLGLGRAGWCSGSQKDPTVGVTTREAVVHLGFGHEALGSERDRGGNIRFRCLNVSGSRMMMVAKGQDQIKGLPVEVDKVLNDLGARKVGRTIQVSLPGDVLFDFNKWHIKKRAEKTLEKLVQAIKKLKIKEILIEGYTDSRGSKEYNLTLSKRRAEAVKLWLVEKGGVTGTRIVTKGCGESNPLAPNTHPDGTDNPAGRAKNRRVEIYVTLEGL